MLKLADKDNLESILEFCDGDLLGTRIACYCLAYGFDRDFLNVWIDEDNGKTSTVIAKFYDNITLKTIAVLDDEIKNFLYMIGFSSLEVSADVCDSIGLVADEVKYAYIFAGEPSEIIAENLSEEHYRALYDLVSKNIPGSFSSEKEAYLSFLSDFTFRKHRNLARSKGMFVDEKLSSSVITAAETQSCALISAVTSDKNVRGLGLGKKTVLSMTSELMGENKKVFVVALNESAQSFYEHIGFSYFDKIAIIKS